jgi:hypothetical protein
LKLIAGFVATDLGLLLISIFVGRLQLKTSCATFTFTLASSSAIGKSLIP